MERRASRPSLQASLEAIQTDNDSDAAMDHHKSWLLEVLKCPITGEDLEWAEDQLLVELNQRIEAGKVFDRGGDAVFQPIHVGLVNRSRQWLYRDCDDWLDFLPTHAVPL